MSIPTCGSDFDFAFFFNGNPNDRLLKFVKCQGFYSFKNYFKVCHLSRLQSEEIVTTNGRKDERTTKTSLDSDNTSGELKDLEF